jgi:hypothetical protein
MTEMHSPWEEFLYYELVRPVAQSIPRKRQKYLILTTTIFFPSGRSLPVRSRLLILPSMITMVMNIIFDLYVLKY